MSRLRLLGVLCLAASLGGCSTPTARIDAYGRLHGFHDEVVMGQPFRHVVMRNSRPMPDGTLHVYLEGDGSPYVKPSTVSTDPTSRRPLMLHLMTLDGRRAVYVGRPCYQQASADDACNISYWTVRRFSPEVVASLARVIRSEMVRAGAGSVQLYGHSGGGALAVLLTKALPSVSDVITIAGNLDIDAWARLHGYGPLVGSLNPTGVELPPLLASHSEHFAGGADDNMPAALIREAAGRIGGTFHEIPGYTHACCWEERWRSILSGHSRPAP